MFKHYETQLQTIQRLLEDYVRSGYGKAETEALKQYLNEQDMACVQLAQVILYVGKTKNQVQETTKEALYTNIMNAFNQLKGWRTQEMEVNNMIIKVPMDVEFRKGIAIFETLQ